jgi:uncharacterized protein (TIGR03118 family)
VVNLVTDDQTANPAQITDPSLVNAWGISRSGGSPFWVSSNGMGVATLYSVNPVTQATTKQGLTVTIPGAGNPTGQVFANVAGSFNGDTFLFASEDGTISGWRGALGTAAETLKPGSPSNVYKGLASSTIGGTVYLYGANFLNDTIDVLKGNAGAPNLTGTFTDPSIPTGYAPFNAQNLNNTIYVTYALRETGGIDDDPGPGRGFVDAYDLQGNLLGRVASMGALNSPWGLAIAPASFGGLAGDLLVGNFGDGRINIYSLGTNTFLGQLAGPNGQPIDIDGLWALTTGNGGSGGSANAIYFSAGPDGESHGLFGVISSAPEPGSLSLMGLAMLGLVLGRVGFWGQRTSTP